MTALPPEEPHPFETESRRFASGIGKIIPEVINDYGDEVKPFSPVRTSAEVVG